jgi:CMP-N,N'-diacetyllegionaminic acid synthase
MSNCVALIPARKGSKRIPDKNIQLLGGKPLIYWTIKSALESKVFDYIVVSTDSMEYNKLAQDFGAHVVIRPDKSGLDSSPDIEWVEHALNVLKNNGLYYENFSILRPTSPFRTSETIKRAYEYFINSNCDSLRAVEKCSQHPYKMWTLNGEYIKPLIESGLHSQPYQTLPEIWVQNASLEMAHSYVIYSLGSISGTKIIPFFTQGYEGVDINTEYDLKYTEWLIATGKVKLGE